MIFMNQKEKVCPFGHTFSFVVRIVLKVQQQGGMPMLFLDMISDFLVDRGIQAFFFFGFRYTDRRKDICDL